MSSLLDVCLPPPHGLLMGIAMKRFLIAFSFFALLGASAFANVIVTSPQSGETVGTSASFVASANTTTCPRGVASMGIYVDNQLKYVVNGTTLNTSLQLSLGKHNAVVQEWDFCGGATTTAIPVTVAVQAAVSVTSPANNATIGELASYVATATSSCPKGVAAMGVYVNNQLTYIVQGGKLNTQISLNPGTQHTVVQEWDNCGGSTTTPVIVTVPQNIGTFKNLQTSKGWNSWGQLGPVYADCNAPCPGVNWSMSQSVKAPSTTGNATQFNLGGTTPYSDVLFEDPLIGDFSTQGLPDLNHTLVPSLHNFTYDAWFYLSNPSTTQAVEFDINWFENTIGMTWGTECRVAGGNEWDIWDNVNARWVATGIACYPYTTGWNHVTLNMHRTTDNRLIYQSITLNGNTAILNKIYAPFTVPADWYGITVNYQMDGDKNQNSITSYVDNFSFMYW
jgi:hypothetical protein